MDVETARTWLAAYARAWEQGDPEAAAALFAEPSTYRSMIFEEPHRGRAGVREYWARATGTQSDVQVRTGEPVVEDSTVVAEWWTTMDEAEDGAITLPGVLVLSFDRDGLCRALREYWAFGPGRHEPPPHWGEVDLQGDGAAAAARSWARRYEEAWRTLDVEAVVPLFTDDAVYQSHPLREAVHGHAGVRDYTARAYGAEAAGPVEARLAVVAAAGRTAVVEYWANVVEDGGPHALAGCDLLLFDDHGRARMLRDYWHTAPGHREPPAEWGA